MRKVLCISLLFVLFSHYGFGMFRQCRLLIGTSPFLTQSTRTFRAQRLVTLRNYTSSRTYDDNDIQDLIKRDPTAAILTTEYPLEWLEEEKEKAEKPIKEKLNSSNFFYEFHKLDSLYRQLEEKFLEDTNECRNEDICNLFQSICRSSELDSEKIALVESPTISLPVCSTLNSIKIHSNFPKNSQAIKDYRLTHEVRRIAHKDYMSMFIAIHLFDKENPEDIQKIHRLSRFQEMRADVEAALKSQLCAHGLYDAARQTIFLLHLTGDVEGEADSHPLYITRSLLASKILHDYYLRELPIH